MGHKKVNISQAMLVKKTISNSCNIRVNMLDTIDGIILSIEEKLVNNTALTFINNYVEFLKLNLLLDNECYFISTNILKPTAQYAWE
jgi:hypothetical protein